ncbi:MAG: hypothetical protein VR67_05730 [Peptococcaceae bacterium BRH_c8a]|nr:MAG: hypothetical protein VR67_05730 [Peptococcaceae bacterium BRH_c8a]
MHVTFLSYNIRHCRGTGGRVSLAAVAASITGTGADVVGLQEVDKFNPRSCFVNQARKLGELTGMSAVLGANFNLLGIAEFGNAVLTRYRVMDEQNFPLPGRGEKRGLQRIEICTGTGSIAFYNTHLGLDKDERRHQVERILTITKDEKMPLVLAGDFNALPRATEIQELKKVFALSDPSGSYPTFPAQQPQHKIDYVFFSPHWLPLAYQVYYSEASDHLPLAVKLRLVGDNPTITI